MSSTDPTLSPPKVGILMGRVRELIAPIERQCAAEVARLEAREAQRQSLLALLQELQKKAANIE